MILHLFYNMIGLCYTGVYCDWLKLFLVPVRCLPRSSRSMHFGDMSETNPGARTTCPETHRSLGTRQAKTQYFRACLHGGGGPQIGEVTCSGSPHLSCKRDQIKIRDYVDRRVIPPKRVTSPPGVPHLHVNGPLVFETLHYKQIK